jgi:mono/diheme cytochrome c family protein
MKFIFPKCVFLFLLLSTLPVASQSGEELFKSTCSSCHTIGQGRLIGPDLSGVTEKMPADWLLKFIRSSQTMIKSGDPDANAIFNEFNKIPMPDVNLSDDQIKSILDYIKSLSGGAQQVKQPQQQGKADSLAAGPQQAPPSADSLNKLYTPDMADIGRSLFSGRARFANNATPCMSCHNINDQSLLGGGRLALDLTFAWSKLGPNGIGAILANPPFPAMKLALMNRPLTDDETTALISLLKEVDERANMIQVRKSGGFLFFTIAFVTAMFILAHIYVLYDNRKIPLT